MGELSCGDLSCPFLGRTVPDEAYFRAGLRKSRVLLSVQNCAGGECDVQF